IDFMIVRGLDYYTGTVFEIMLEDYREIGSISGGGRYENLASNFTDQKFPGVGGSISPSVFIFFSSISSS
ncbi:MAG: ATP phosphoribosyltransferase regulatory subunit, partial [Campylobacter sp.]|nr:ATP phosphoribosyltransferase regulatory subunit [Campylobacter sp.]